MAARLLTPKQREQLAQLATRVSFNERAVVYKERTPATAVYICREGALRASRELPSGKRRVVAFMFKDDLFGLAQNGLFLNTVQALTRSVCYRIPREPLKELLQKDGELEFQFLCKVIHELRELQFRVIVLGRRSAAGRVAMFLTMLEKNLYGPTPTGVIPLHMTRSDIAGYLGLSLESVSRACKRLVDTGLIKFPNQRTVQVLDRKHLEQLSADV